MKNYFISFFAILAISIFTTEVSASTCSSLDKCSEKSLKRNDRNRGNSNNGNSRAQRNRGNTRSQNNRANTTTRTNRNRGTTTTRSSRNNSRNTSTTITRNRNNRTSGSRVTTTRSRTDRVSRQNSSHRSYGHRPNWNRPNYRYVRNVHTHHNISRVHHRNWNSRRNYFRTISYRDIYWDRWLRVRVTWNNGYYWENSYPWYSYNGYRHRYSPVDTCNYELVDGWNNTVERTYYNSTCSFGYDQCADERDRLNDWSDDYRYFCSERLEGSVDDYGYDYNDDFYSDIYSEEDEWDQDFDNNWN